MRKREPPPGSSGLDIDAVEGLLTLAAMAVTRHPRLAAVLTAVAAPAPADQHPGEGAALAAFRAQRDTRADAQLGTKAASMRSP